MATIGPADPEVPPRKGNAPTLQMSYFPRGGACHSTGAGGSILSGEWLCLPRQPSSSRGHPNAARSLQPWPAEPLSSPSCTALRRLRQVSRRPQQKQVGKNTNLSSSSDCGSKLWARPSLTGRGERTSRYQYEFPRARLTCELQFGDVCLLCVHWGGFLPCRGRSNLCIGSTVALLSTHSTSTHETVIHKAQLLCYPRILAVFYS